MNSENDKPEIEMGADSAEAPADEGRGRSLLREVLETVVMALLVWAAIAIFIPPYEVGGSSMEPAITDGQQVLTSRAAYWFRSPRRGDIVVLRSPEDRTDILVKRVIALPGETVTIEDFTVYVGNAELDEPYLPAGAAALYDGEWDVPENTLFVMGDNRMPSRDSRAWGPISTETVIGKAWLIYWPVNAWGRIQHYRHPDPLPTLAAGLPTEETASFTPSSEPIVTATQTTAATDVPTQTPTPEPTRVPPTSTPTPSEPVSGTTQVMTFIYSENSFESDILLRLYVDTEVVVLGRDRSGDWFFCRKLEEEIDGWVWAGTIELASPDSPLDIIE